MLHGLRVLRVSSGHDALRQLQILRSVERRRTVVFPHGDVHILPYGRNDLVLPDQPGKRTVAQLLQKCPVGLGPDDIRPAAVRVGVEIPPVMEKAVIFGVLILPGPVLARQLAVAPVQAGDILSAIIPDVTVQRPVSQRRPHMDGIQQAAFRHGKRLVARDEYSDVRRVSLSHGHLPFSLHLSAIHGPPAGASRRLQSFDHVADAVHLLQCQVRVQRQTQDLLRRLLRHRCLLHRVILPYQRER